MEPQTKPRSVLKNQVRQLSSPGFVHRWPVFYGWIVMVAGSLGLVMTSPGQTYTVSIFIEYFIRDLSISRSAVSTLYSLGTLAGSLTLPLWGRQIDRHGSRKMVVIIAFLFGLACIYMGFVQNILMLGVGFIANQVRDHPDAHQGKEHVCRRNSFDGYCIVKEANFLVQYCRYVSGLSFIRHRLCHARWLGEPFVQSVSV